MNGKINCRYNDEGAWCRCKEVKRSLFGLGVRLCVEFPPGARSSKTCEFKVPFPRPAPPPAMPPAAAPRLRTAARG